jgi:putative aldouronate transport system substrate-binding protein
MKHIKTSIINLSLAITVITAILLSGCSAQSAGNDSPIPSINTNKDLELEPYEIVIYFPGSGTQQDTSLVEKEAAKLLKDINVTIRLHSINSSDWLNKKRMILYSAEKADLIFTASWSEYFEEIGRGVWTRPGAGRSRA